MWRQPQCRRHGLCRCDSLLKMNAMDFMLTMAGCVLDIQHPKDLPRYLTASQVRFESRFPSKTTRARCVFLLKALLMWPHRSWFCPRRFMCRPQPSRTRRANLPRRKRGSPRKTSAGVTQFCRFSSVSDVCSSVYARFRLVFGSLSTDYRLTFGDTNLVGSRCSRRYSGSSR